MQCISVPRNIQDSQENALPVTMPGLCRLANEDETKMNRQAGLQATSAVPICVVCGRIDLRARLATRENTMISVQPMLGRIRNGAEADKRKGHSGFYMP